MDSELLQSFVRVRVSSDDIDLEPRSVYALARINNNNDSQQGARKAVSQEITGEIPKQFLYQSRRNKNNVVIEMKKPRKSKEGYDEVYTDKDRAAAVSFGSFDIKQSLNIKQQTDRNAMYNIPEEADPSTILMLGMREIKNGNLENGIMFLSKAIDITPENQDALIARSKCYMKIGKANKALEDAESALALDGNNIRAIYQKAEALYFMGNFEHSLMYFHRGIKLRPELQCLRLGIQKTQEAIRNTIGGVQKASVEMCTSPDFSSGKPSPVPSKSSRSSRSSRSTLVERKQSKKLLGELFVDKEYLENLLKHPDLKRADTKTENVSSLAKDAISFLNNRQEFWKQQKPTSTNSRV